MSLTRSRSVCWRYIPFGAYVGSPQNAGIDGVQIIFNKRAKFDGTEPGILMLHGHSGTAYAMGVPFPTFTHQALEMVRAGYIVVSIDAGGTRGWPSPLVNAVIENAVAWMQQPKTDDDFASGVGVKAGKIGLYGYSMGGGNAITYARLHPSKVAACLLFAPAINLDVFYSPEVDCLYCGSAYIAASGASTVTTSPSTVTTFSDASVLDPAGVIDRVSGTSVVQFAYTSRDTTHLFGCTVASGTVAIGNGNILAQANRYTGHEGFNAHYDASIGLYSSSTYQIPTRLYHGSADTTVAPATIAAFLASAANPGYLIDHIIPNAIHTDLFQYLASEADIPFMANYLS